MKPWNIWTGKGLFHVCTSEVLHGSVTCLRLHSWVAEPWLETRLPASIAALLCACLPLLKPHLHWNLEQSREAPGPSYIQTFSLPPAIIRACSLSLAYTILPAFQTPHFINHHESNSFHTFRFSRPGKIPPKFWHPKTEMPNFILIETLGKQLPSISTKIS